MVIVGLDNFDLDISPFKKLLNNNTTFNNNFQTFLNFILN